LPISSAPGAASSSETSARRVPGRGGSPSNRVNEMAMTHCLRYPDISGSNLGRPLGDGGRTLRLELAGALRPERADPSGPDPQVGSARTASPAPRCLGRLL